MPRPLYVVDAFTDRPFSGNPAAVVFLPAGEPWPQREYLRSVAREMNLSETAFVRLPIEPGQRFGLRWFTPSREIDLCGHATLAAAHALYDAGRVSLHQPVEFETRSGVLRAAPDQDWRGFWLDFPATPPRWTEPVDGLLEALRITEGPRFVGKSLPPDGRVDQSENDYFDWFIVTRTADAIRAAKPDFEALNALTSHEPGIRGLIVAAVAEPDSEAHVVSRCFYPGYGINEDPVTGSAHCTIGPYFAKTLNRSELVCHQLSPRGGSLRVRVIGPRVHLGGRAVTTIRGQLVI